MSQYTSVASDTSIEKTKAALSANGFEVLVVESAEAAKACVLGLIPEGSEVFTASSVTADSIGVSQELNESGRYDAVKPKLYSMDQATQGRQMRKLGAGPDVVVGSVHAVTETGTLLIASLTGSQLPAYAYGSASVVFVVGTQKIVGTLDDAWKRLEEHVVPLESERARKAYGLPEGFKTFPSKVLLVNKEIQPGRIKVVLVKEALGF